MNKKMLNANIESLLLTFLVYLIFFKFSGDKSGYFNMNIHPLVAVVAIQSIRYGTILTLSTVIYAVFFYMFPYYELGYDLVLFFSIYKYYKFIIMFIVVNLFLGRARDKFDFKLKLLADLREKDRVFLDKLKKQNSEIITVNGVLEKRVVNSRESILALHRIEKGLKNVDKNGFFEKTIELFEEYLHADIISVYKIENEFLKKVARKGESKNGDSLKISELPKNISNTLSDGKPYDLIDEETGSRQYLSPLKINDKTIGLVHVEKFKYTYKDAYQFDIFSLLVEKIQEIYKEKVDNYEK